MQDRYNVVTGPPMSPPNASADGLAQLAAELNALDHPAAAALSDLTVGMVELAFNSLPPGNRQELLRSLGIRMAAPRRAGGALCQDVLTRLRRESRQHTCTCGIGKLTRTVISQVDRFVFAQDAETVPDPTARWSAPLVRTAVFASCNASVADAYILAWAADQEWFAVAADEKEKARLAAVADTARSIVAANPDFVPGGSENREPSSAGDGKRERAVERADPKTTAPDPAPCDDVPAMAPQDPPNGEALDPEAVCPLLESALTEARASVERVAGALADGRPPQDADLTPLTTLGVAFDDADDVLRAVGIEGVPRRLADMTHAVQAYREEQQRDVQAREFLRELLDVVCRPDSPAAFAAEAVRAATRSLLDAPGWGQTQREESATLAALARLIRSGRQADAAKEILDLQDRVVRVLPACVMAVVMVSELTFATGRTPARADSDGTGADTAEPASGTTTAEDTAIPPAGPVVPPGQPDGSAPEAPAVGPRTAGTTPAPARAADSAPQATAAEPPHLDEEQAPTPADSDTAPLVDSDTASPDVPAAVPTPTDLRPAKNASAPETVTDVDEGSEGSEEATAERALARLVVERRFGLAQHVASALGRPEPHAAALRLAGAAALLTSGDSQGARLTTDLLQRYGGYAGRDAEGIELLLLPALLRTALITGDHLAGAQLKALVPRLPDRLGEAAAAVADRALSGALMIASPLVVIADVSGTEARLGELRDQCHTLLAPQRLRFARATEIAKRWLAADEGMLGSLLMTVVRDNRDAVPQAREQVERLSKLAEINNEIDRMDRKHRSSSGKPLQGSGRQDLVHVVERTVGLVKEWCLAVDGARRSDRSDGDRAVKEISSLRQSLLNAKEEVLAELEQLARHSGTGAAATAWAARASMDELFALLAGDLATTRPGGWAEPELVLDAELLKVCDTRAERPSLDKLLTAVDRSWQTGLAERLDHDAFTAAHSIVELAGHGLLPAARTGEFTVPALIELSERAAARRAELGRAHDELVAELHRAQADGAVTDDQDLSLQELLADARNWLDGTEPDDLLDTRRALDTVRNDLPAFRQQAADRIRARLDALELTTEERAQVLRHLDTGGLATAADLVYFMEIGEDVPEIEGGESHLTDFFPAVPDGLPKGIDSELVGLVRSGGTHPTVPVLDYRDLSTDEAALAADILDEWRTLAANEPKDRLEVSAKRQVPRLLKLLGYDAKSARPLDERSPHLRRREYRLFEATEVEINGKAKAPAFGSQIREQGGNLRVLLVWGRPPAKVVMNLAERDASGASLLVVYFGTLSREARVELAVGSGRLQPLLVVDDAALAYLAARGNRQVSTATQTLLPFSGVNPYIREKRGRIGGEMFYGRDAERKSILDPRGTQVIYGGRGLGKSALLADAGERFTEQRPGYHQAVYVNLDQENIGKGSSFGPERLWSVLGRELTEAQILDDRPQGRRKGQEISERVRAGIRTWLDGDSRRRLLILLDECDQFFEADAPRFDQTKKLKGLGSDTKDRAKVVFAGLHSVQRFSKLASNGPFGHLAQTPKVIGPLAPQSAAELLVEPMRGLGFEFKDLDLVNRVLGYCSYQPFLLQMFGHRLVELMHRKRARRGAEGPAYEVEVTDIEVVESDAALRDGISAAFKDTLSLDHRYDVIANVLAYHARLHGLEGRLSDTELREECETYWRRGFEQLDTEGFRAYLSEMVGLGILAPNHDGLGWHLRGPNALRMIGTSHEVEARLLRAEQDCELQESIVQEGRPELPDGQPAPLTNTQLDDLLGERSSRTRVVLGTSATGVTEVARTLRTIAGPIDGWTLPPVGKPSVYKQELTGGRPRERRVVISDFVNYRDPVRPETCREAVDLAETLLPTTAGVTRAVVLVTDTTQLALWRSLLTGTEPTSAAPVVLRRHDRRSLRGWAQRVNMFHTEDRLDRLYGLTSGWPLLVGRAHRMHAELGDPDEVLRRLADAQADRSEARAFAEATGVYADPLLVTGYRILDDEFKEGLFDLDSAVTAVAVDIDDEDEAGWIVNCLDALQVFDREIAQLRLEPLLRQCVALHA
ncbi:NUP-1 [Streptomyces sp. NRRL F-525]|uniref:NUP-1 n=1 Tax=Streptomyces sp. NRRL F-525 TaxID=1463861 RepID=UPI0005279F69|nr:NUP-1 [Streptomyces sp. NRRL F-525]